MTCTTEVIYQRTDLLALTPIKVYFPNLSLQMDNESARSSSHPNILPSHSNNESSSAGSSSAESAARNQSIQATEAVDKVRILKHINAVFMI